MSIQFIFLYIKYVLEYSSKNCPLPLVATVISVCRCFKDQVMRQQTPIQGIAPLRSAVRKLQTLPEHLTTLHSDFLLLCLLAKCYKAGLSVLDSDILESENLKDLFLFYYYGYTDFPINLCILLVCN
jgi:hypothetical protein